MRILHVFDHSIPLHSGYTFRSLAILREQRKLGYETLQLTSPKHYNYDGNDLEETVDGYHFYRCKPNPILQKLPLFNQWDVVRALKSRLKQIITNNKIDVIHAHSPCLNGIAALWAGKKFNIPVVYEMRASWEDAAVNHGTCNEDDLRYKISRALETYVLKRVNAITTICEGLKSDISIRGINESIITVIPNAVDIEQFSFESPINQEIKTKLNYNNEIILGFIGSFYDYEGLHLLIESMPLILEHNPNTKLLFVGGGFQEENLKSQVKKLNLTEKVTFAGRVHHSEVHDYYNLVDIFVYPRLPIRLTEKVTPLKPLEAMAQGRLVVASDVGGHKELISHKQTGYCQRLLFLLDKP